MLNILTQLPVTLLDTPATELHSILPGPTLIHLEGQRPEPLFVSVLLHGNETTGYYAIQELLKKYQDTTLPRALSIFIGNVDAARHAQRRLDSQLDYNRIWPHADFSHPSPESKMMQQVKDEMQQRNVFVSIDIHNNTGLNPHYACINKMENAFYQLATIFSRTVIYFIRPQGVQSQAFAEICPSVTVECGKTEHRHGITHAVEFIESCLHLSELPSHPLPQQDIDLFHTVATVKVDPLVSFSFDHSTAGLQFVDELEKLNFSELPTGTSFGDVDEAVEKPFDVIDEHGNEVYGQYFEIKNGKLCTKTVVMPSMLCTEAEIIRKDCLCYLMERISI